MVAVALAGAVCCGCHGESTDKEEPYTGFNFYDTSEADCARCQGQCGADCEGVEMRHLILTHYPEEVSGCSIVNQAEMPTEAATCKLCMDACFAGTFWESPMGTEPMDTETDTGMDTDSEAVASPIDPLSTDPHVVTGALIRPPSAGEPTAGGTMAFPEEVMPKAAATEDGDPACDDEVAGTWSLTTAAIPPGDYASTWTIGADGQAVEHGGHGGRGTAAVEGESLVIRWTAEAFAGEIRVHAPRLAGWRGSCWDAGVATLSRRVLLPGHLARTGDFPARWRRLDSRP